MDGTEPWRVFLLATAAFSKEFPLVPALDGCAAKQSVILRFANVARRLKASRALHRTPEPCLRKSPIGPRWWKPNNVDQAFSKLSFSRSQIQVCARFYSFIIKR
jgi:hypothetical protein